MKLKYIIGITALITLNLSININSQSLTNPGAVPELICEMPDTGLPNDNFIPMRASVQNRIQNNQGCATIEVTYNGFPTDIFGNPGPEQKAFQYAIDIWEALLDSPQTIRIDANWAPAGNSSLGGASPTGYFSAPGSTDNVIYPVALYEAINNIDVNLGGDDIFCTFNSNRGDWFFPSLPDGVDVVDNINSQITPPGQFNFTAVVLHEIGHGLGILGFGRRVSSSTGGDVGILRRLPSGGIPSDINNPNANFLSPWDTFIDGRNILGIPQPITDEAAYPDPSLQMLIAFEQETLPLTCNSSRAITANTDGVELRIEGRLFNNDINDFEFRNGSSYSHWDEDTVNGTDFALMTPFLGPGETVYDPGDVTLAFMEDMGWKICGRSFLSTPEFTAAEVNISPNPFTKLITIELPNALANDDYTISIADINGRVVSSQSNITASGNGIELQLDNLKPALYFMTIESETKDVRFTKKIVKK